MPLDPSIAVVQAQYLANQRGGINNAWPRQLLNYNNDAAPPPPPRGPAVAAPLPNSILLTGAMEAAGTTHE